MFAVSRMERSVQGTCADLTPAVECWEIGLFATASPGLEPYLFEFFLVFFAFLLMFANNSRQSKVNFSYPEA